MDIDFQFLVDLYKRQQGLCKYSGIPLTFEAIEDWKMSLERIDVLKGYTRENVCLICQEFNTGDYTVIYKYQYQGSSAWSADKFRFFVDTAKVKYGYHSNK